MTKETLQTQISDLHETLQQTTAVSPETKERLNTLEAEIQLIVQEPESLDPASLATRLEEFLAEFEADHPQLTTRMQMLINSLSNMGI